MKACCFGGILGLALVAGPSLFLGVPTQAPAQPASIEVQVSDPSGAAIPKARILILPLLDAIGGTPMIGSDGKVSINLPPGRYPLRVHVLGFRAWKGEIEARPGTRQTVPVFLEIPSYSNCVTVGTQTVPLSPPPSFPEQSQVLSPDGRYRLVRTGWPSAGHHMVLLEDRVHKSRRKLFQYHKRVTFSWYTDNLFAAKDQLGDGSSTAVYYSVHPATPSVQALDLVFSQCQEDERGSLEKYLSTKRVDVVTGPGGPCAAMLPTVGVSAYGTGGTLEFEWTFYVHIPNEMF